jgi:hypothetical protein
VNRVVRAILLGVGIGIALVVLFTIVFPWFDATFVNDPVMGAARFAAAAA